MLRTVRSRDRQNGGGVPRIGNGAFRLEVTATPTAPTLTGIVAGGAAAQGPLLILGMDIAIDPASLITNFVGPGAASFVQTIPLPNDPGLVGVRFFFQSINLEPGGGLASSRGLSMTILP